MHPDMTRATFRSRIFHRARSPLQRGAAERWPTFEPKRLRGYLGPLARPFRTYERTLEPAWRRERPNSCHGLPYGNDHPQASALHHRQGRCGRGRPFRDFSPLSNFFLLLLRSRGALGRVRATPGAPSAAAASMDGPDGRAGGRPGAGKGLTLVDTLIYACWRLHRCYCVHSVASTAPLPSRTMYRLSAM